MILSITTIKDRTFLLCGKTPCLGEEIVVLWKKPQHTIQVTSKQIFSTDFCHSWKMIDLLISFHIFRSFHAHAQICPVKVPAAILGNFFHPETSRHSSHHVVFAITRAYCQVSVIVDI